MTSRESSTEAVHEKLRAAIVTGELPAGSRHSIYQLAEYYGVSRTPVRDAVLRLADTGMLSIERNRGVVVRGFSVHEIRQVFEMRILLEVPAAAAAAHASTTSLMNALDACLGELDAAARAADSPVFARHDRQLHRLILESSANTRLADTVEKLRDATQMRGVSTFETSRSLQEVESEHLPIIEAIRNRDSVAAAERMREHLVATGLLLMRQVAENTGETLPSIWPTDLVTQLP